MLSSVFSDFKSVVLKLSGNCHLFAGFISDYCIFVVSAILDCSYSNYLPFIQIDVFVTETLVLYFCSLPLTVKI